MAEETTTTPTTPATEMEKGQGQTQVQAQSQGDSTETETTSTEVELERVRKALKEANRESAERRKKLEAYEKADTDKKTAELTEVERLKKQFAEAQAAAEKATTEARQTRIRGAVETAAARIGFHQPEDAVALADLSGIEVDPQGKVTGVDEALKALVKARPYLVKVTTQSQGTGNDATARGKSGGIQYDDNEIKRAFGLTRR